MPLEPKDFARDREKSGIRGGLGLFKWEDVAKDKDKTHYLGNSVRSSTGLWAKRKDLNWFNVQKEEGKQVDLDEIAEIKRREAEAMAEALGATVPRPLGDEQAAQEAIKKDLEERAVLDHRVVGLGVQGAAKRELVQETKRQYRNRSRSPERSTRRRSRSREKKSKKDRKRSRSREKEKHSDYERSERRDRYRRRDDRDDRDSNADDRYSRRDERDDRYSRRDDQDRTDSRSHRRTDDYQKRPRSRSRERFH
ncbi:hypothetical protein HDV03_002748 [Kappamyces sp. JEL0829]|nr:hypothetical protein HDV03_002748 [Kappamyces sp. JEL0829]